VLRRELLRGVLEQGMKVRIITWRWLHVRGRGIRGSGWSRIIGWHRGITRRYHVWPRRNIRITLGRRTTA